MKHCSCRSLKTGIYSNVISYIENWAETCWQISKCLSLDMANRLQRLPEVIGITIYTTLKREEERNEERKKKEKDKENK
jgi:hypothetical protein